MVQYEENLEGVMIYRMLDDKDLDPVNDGFTLEEATLFVENTEHHYYNIHDWCIDGVALRLPVFSECIS